MAFKLLKSQKNNFFRLIKENNLNPENFSLRYNNENEKPDNDFYELVFLGSEFYFRFYMLTQTQFGVRHSPGMDTWDEKHYPVTLESMFNTFVTWLSYLKREIETPDLWEELTKEKQFSQAIGNEEIENTPFIPEEIKEIERNLSEIKQFLITTNTFNEEQKIFLDARLKYLEDSSTRVGRKDWINLLLSTLVTIILNMTLTPDSSRELFRLAGTVFNWLLKNTPLIHGI